MGNPGARCHGTSARLSEEKGAVSDWRNSVFSTLCGLLTIGCQPEYYQGEECLDGP